MVAADAAGGGGGGGGNNTITLTTTSNDPAAGSSFWLSGYDAPASAPYRIVYSLTDQSPFFASFNGIVHTGTTTAFGTMAVIKVVPGGASGKTAFMELQSLSGGLVTDSNTVRLDIP